MSVQSEATDQLIRLSFSGMQLGLRMAGNGAVHTAKLLRSLATQSGKTKGKIRLQNMLKSGKPLKIFSLLEEDLPRFCIEARRYGILYSMVRDKKGEEGIVDIYVKEMDAARVNRILDHFQMAEPDFSELEKEVRQSVGEQINLTEKEAKPKNTEHLIHNDQVMQTVFSDKPAKQNPAQARPQAQMSPRSVPSSASNKKLEGDFFNSRPSVRKEMRQLQRELYERAKRYNRSIENKER